MIAGTTGGSIATRLGAGFALVSALVIAGLGFYLYGVLEQGMRARHETLLTTMVTLVRNMMEDVPSRERLLQHPDIVGHILVGHPRVRLWIYGEDARAVFASAGTTVPRHEWENLVALHPTQVAMKRWRPTEDTAYQLAVTRFSAEEVGIRQGFIVLAYDVTEESRLLQLIQTNLIVAMMAGMVASAVLGLLMVRGQLRPLARIAEAALHISASRLNERLELKGVPRELQLLVTSFNGMLARVEESFRKLSDFSADLAHDLRTPLTSLLGRSQATLLQKRSANDYRKALEANVETAERMSALVSDMLFLARADHAQSALAYKMEDVDLREEVERLIEYFGIACHERGVCLEAHGHARAFADRAMLRRALSNLLSNAVRHSPDGERIEVVIGRAARAATVSVIDHGAGIAPEHASRIFDRFYRSDPSRTRVSGGTGLGLAITQSIMRLHGGDVLLKSDPGKETAFTLVIPDSTQQSGAAA